MRRCGKCDLTHGGADNVEECKVGGPNAIVEVDESKFGKRKYNRGYRVEGVWVVVAIERNKERKLFVSSVENCNRIICVKYTDGWRGYNSTDISAITGVQLPMGHRRVNHSREFRAADGTHTNTVEGTNSGLRQNIKLRRRNKKHIDLSLLEFTLRRLNKKRLWRRMWYALANEYVLEENVENDAEDENDEEGNEDDYEIEEMEQNQISLMT